jgi:hypothetical protein
MSDPAKEATIDPEPRPQVLGSPLVAIAAAGGASGLLCVSMALAPLCLIPVQVAYGRRGNRAGTMSALAAVGIAAATMAVWLATKGRFSLALVASSLVSPLVLFGALVLVNAGFWKGIPATYRVLAVSAACALASIPALLAFGRDQGISEYIESWIEAFVAPLRAAKAGDGGYDYSALVAALDPKAFAASALKILYSSYTAILAFVLGGSVWVGNRLSGPGSHGREDSPPLAGYRAPHALLWAFLAAWTLVLAAMMLEPPEILQALAWNCALAVSLAFAAQGAGIAASLFDRWKMPRFMRIALAATAVLSLATPTGGVFAVALAIALPLLGVTEVWIPYRNPKGVGA